VELVLSRPVDCLGDWTFDFYWQHRGNRLEPDSPIPFQVEGDYSYRDVVEALREGEDVWIRGDVGGRLGSSMGVDLRFFGGSGRRCECGRIFVEGDVVGKRAGISMLAGAIYVKGGLAEPLGNIVEVPSDVKGFHKFRSITELLLTGGEVLPPNQQLEDGLVLRDGIVRDTLAARLPVDKRLLVEGDAGMSSGILMEAGLLQIRGDAGRNTGVLMRGGTIVVEGDCGEFAATRMTGGKLVIQGRVGGYLGGGLRGGVVYLKRKTRPLPPLAERELTREDQAFLQGIGVGRIAAQLYYKYGV